MPPKKKIARRSKAQADAKSGGGGGGGGLDRGSVRNNDWKRFAKEGFQLLARDDVCSAQQGAVVVPAAAAGGRLVSGRASSPRKRSRPSPGLQDLERGLRSRDQRPDDDTTSTTSTTGGEQQLLSPSELAALKSRAAKLELDDAIAENFIKDVKNIWGERRRQQRSGYRGGAFRRRLPWLCETRRE